MDRFKIAYRAARAVDAAGIARVQVETWRDAYVGILPDKTLIDLDPKRAKERWAMVVAGGEDAGLFMVALWRGRVVGFCQGGLPEARPRGADGGVLAGTGEVYTLYVDPSFQGQGIGTALFFSVTGRLRELGCQALTVLALAENRSARAFYARLGAVAREDVPSVVLGHPTAETPYFWEDIGMLLARIEETMS